MSPRGMRNVGFEMVICKFQIFRMNQYDKIICIDSDVLVVNDIRELFENDIEFGAAPDRIDKQYGINCYVERKNEYFNSGILIVGKKYMTEDVILGCDEILRKWENYSVCDIKHMGGLCPEQDVLNIFFHNKEMTLIPSKYNLDRFYCDKNDCNDVKIIHYLTRNKPWFVLKDGLSYEGWTQIEWERYYNDYLEWLSFYTLHTNNCVLKFPKHYDDKDKYLVIACAKNENKYIREWIQHYLNLNFDKLIICDNNDDDSLLDVVSDYIEQGVVEVFNCHGLKNFQADILAMFCTEGNYKWCGYFDCDEFLELGAYGDIKKYLEKKEGDCITFNWIMFDSNGNMEYEDKPLSDRFTIPYLPITNIENAFVKCLMSGGHFKYGDVMNDGGHMYRALNEDKISYNFGGYCLSKLRGENLQAILPLRYKDGYLKHYYTKSFEEWCNKSRRGWPDGGALPMSRFFRINNTIKYDRKKYANTLFIDENTFEKINDLPDDCENVKFFIFWSDGCYDYAYTVRVMYAMYKCENSVFIIGGNGISDEQYNFLLECSFITNNKIAYVNEESEIEEVFKKYNKNDEIITYWKKHI